MVAGVLAEGDEEVDKAKEKKLLENGFKYFETPNLDFVVHAAFPYVWEYSCYIAIMKVYPKLGEYIKVSLVLSSNFFKEIISKCCVL